MSQHYHYRKAGAEDAKQLKILALRSYGQYADVLGKDHWATMKNNLDNESMYQQLLGHSECFICECDGRIVGMAFLIPRGNPTAFFDKDWAYIRLVGIDPDYEGKGIGRKLTERCVEYAIQAGESTIALHTSEYQNAARHIYENLGFKKLRELDPIFGKRYWLYTLQLKDAQHRILYSRATINDLDTLIDLRIQFAIDLGGKRDAEVLNKLKTQLTGYFKKSFANNTSIWYLAKINNMPAGVGGVMIREQPGNFINPGGMFGYVINMYTVPSFRRKGICGTILDLLVKAASHEGVTGFELHATKEGEPVYKQHGFHLHNEPTYRKYIQ